MVQNAPQAQPANFPFLGPLPNKEKITVYKCVAFCFSFLAVKKHKLCEARAPICVEICKAMQLSANCAQRGGCSIV